MHIHHHVFQYFFTKIFAQGNYFFFASRLLVWFALVAPCCDPYQRKTIIFQNRNNFMVRMILEEFLDIRIAHQPQKIAWCQNSTFAQMHFKKLKEELQATHSHSDRLAFSGKKIWHLMAANEGPFVLFILALQCTLSPPTKSKLVTIVTSSHKKAGQVMHCLEVFDTSIICSRTIRKVVTHFYCVLAYHCPIFFPFVTFLMSSSAALLHSFK